ncbi:Cof-type HAD-IIB family hydrolase [Pasteurellaceae bacterium TAE3-ERU1]|nr:Cof-type HAD-IIB family hydrolase [Pasteurellaceae bacterium TAE3-ERU1]
MNNYKLIALDMDGTLLDSQKRISERNRQAILAAKNRGVRVVLASGRPFAGLKHYFEQLEMTSPEDYVLCFNGAQVKRISDEKIIQDFQFTGREAKLLAEHAKSIGINLHAFSPSRGLISPDCGPCSQHEAEINKITLNQLDFAELSDEEPIIKVLYADEAEKVTHAMTTLPQTLKEQFTVVQSTPFFMEFLHPKANKGSGIAALAEFLGIAARDVICMGDAGNDAHMVEYAGLGIAMENATDELKAMADAITGHHNDSGVAQAIERYVL